MNYDFIVFGGTGLQGRICVRDLLESGYSVLICGRDPSGIQKLLKNKRCGFLEVDLRDQKKIVSAILKSKAKVVVNCAELTFNVAIMKACLTAKVSCTDLGGLQKVTHEQFKLDSQFKKKGILNITGCGSTPGISNVMVKHAIEHLDSIESINLGFAWDSNIKQFVVPYSMQSIFEEFTEFPVTFHDGKFVKEDRMRCVGIFDFRAVGKQTAYCIVHSEVYSFAKYFKHKGLRSIHYLAGFPEHSMKVIRTLIDLGLSSDKEISIRGQKFKTIDFTNAVLSKIQAPKGYKEVENIWARIDGKKNGTKKEIEMNCIVETMKGWEDAGSNIDTGRTISIISQMLYNGEISETGVHAPEGVIPVKPFFKELAKRKMFVYENGKKLN